MPHEEADLPVNDASRPVHPGGTVITASERFVADIGIRNGRIAACSAGNCGRADREIDATGLLVIPGGVDAHCHIEEPAYQGALLADDFDSATLAAACGGTTTIMSFVNCRLEGSPCAHGRGLS